MTTISVVLPAYNEASCIGTLLDRIYDSLDGLDASYSVIVVDDGSEDNTVEVVEQRAARMPIRILRHETNSGYGAALQTGLLEACQHSDVVVTMDSDDSHDPHLIPEMLKAIDGGQDVVIASRMQPGGKVVGVPFHRRLLSDAASTVLRVVTPMDGVRDFTSGYRAYRATLLHSMVDEREGPAFVNEGGFVAGFAVLLKAWNHGARVTEVPLRLRYDRKLSDSRMQIFATARDYFRLLAARDGYERRPRRERRRTAARQPDRVATAVTMGSDFASVMGAFAVAYVLYGWALQAGWVVGPSPGPGLFMALGGVFAVLSIAVLFRREQYRALVSVPDFGFLQATVQNLVQSAALYLALLFVAGGTSAPTSLIVLGVALSVLAVPLGRRFTWSAGRNWHLRAGRGRRILIYGCGDTGRLLLKKIMQAPGMGTRVVGFIDGLKPVGSKVKCSANQGNGNDCSVPVLGRMRDLEALVSEHEVDELLVAIPLERSDLMRNLLERCEQLEIDVGFVANVGDARADQLRVEDISALTVLRPDSRSPTRAYFVAKRIVDFTLSLILIVATLPMWLVLAVMIRRDSPGPAMFRQERLGEGGKPFEVLKFRTMYVDADPYVRSPASERAPQVTQVGRFLRPAGLDEVPQLVNVLRGEMSLVGPRPLIAIEYGRTEQPRLGAKPGITGLWQLSPDRGQEIHTTMEYDLYYIRRRSLTLDWLILGETALFAMGRFSRAVREHLASALAGKTHAESGSEMQARSVSAAESIELNDGYVFVALDQRRRPDDPASWNLGVSVSVALSRRWPVKLLVAPCNSSLIDGIVSRQTDRVSNGDDPMPEYVEYSSNSTVRVAAEAADVVLTDMPHVAAWARRNGAGLVRVDESGATVEPNGGRPVPMSMLEELRGVVSVQDGIEPLH